MMANKEKELVITADICEKVMFLDCRTDEGIRRLQKSLMKLPMIKSIDDVNTDYMEKCVKKIERKYMIHMGYIMRGVVDCEDHYNGMIKTEKDGRWLKTVTGQTAWEIYAKALFFMYFYITDERRKAENRNKRSSKS